MATRARALVTEHEFLALPGLVRAEELGEALTSELLPGFTLAVAELLA